MDWAEGETSSLLLFFLLSVQVFPLFWLSPSRLPLPPLSSSLALSCKWQNVSHILIHSRHPQAATGGAPPPTGDAPRAKLDGAARVDLNHKFACARCLKPQLQLQQVHSLTLLLLMLLLLQSDGASLGVATPTHDLSGSLICTACPQLDCILSHK